MNYRSESDRKLEIYLNMICIASRYFEVKQLQQQVNTCDLSQVPGNIDSVLSLKIGWQERVSLHYLVVPIEVNNTSVSFSTLSFSSGDKMVLQSQRHGAQETDFMCLERAHELFMVSQSLQKTNVFVYVLLCTLTSCTYISQLFTITV